MSEALRSARPFAFPQKGNWQQRANTKKERSEPKNSLLLHVFSASTSLFSKPDSLTTYVPATRNGVRSAVNAKLLMWHGDGAENALRLHQKRSNSASFVVNMSSM